MNKRQTSLMGWVIAQATANNGLANAPGIDLSIQSVFGIVQGLACWAIRFIFIFIVLAIIWYGIQMILSQGNTTKFGEAKTSLIRAIIGIIIILGAYTIIATVGNAVAAAGGQTWSFVPLACTDLGSNVQTNQPFLNNSNSTNSNYFYGPIQGQGSTGSTQTQQSSGGASLPSAGALGTKCYGSGENSTCQPGLICNGICQRQGGNLEGEACYSANGFTSDSCAMGLTCLADKGATMGTCVKQQNNAPVPASSSRPGDSCISKPCSSGLTCSSNGMCQQPDGNTQGQLCYADNNCASGFHCDYNSGGLLGVQDSKQLGFCTK